MGCWYMLFLQNLRPVPSGELGSLKLRRYDWKIQKKKLRLSITLKLTIMIIYITIFFLMLIMKNKYSFRGSINRTQEEYFHSFIYALHTFFWPITYITNGVYLFIIYLAISCPNKSDSLSVLFLLSYASGLLEGKIGHTYSNK